MSTRANIIAKTGEAWKRIYTHWDGHPDHHGPILLEHYQDQEKIDALMALGDLSILGPEIGKKHRFDCTAKPGTRAWKRHHEEWCLAYGRDRGETGVEADEFETREAAFASTRQGGIEFVYVWDGQSWSVTTPEAEASGLNSGPVDSQRHCVGVCAYRANVGHRCAIGGRQTGAQDAVDAVGKDPQFFESPQAFLRHHHGRGKR